MTKKIVNIVQDLPTEVKIGALNFEIKRINLRKSGACGDCNYEDSEIRIDPSLSEDVTKITYWHEVYHGMLFNAGIVDHSEYETIIDLFAHGMVSVLRYNESARKVY